MAWGCQRGVCVCGGEWRELAGGSQNTLAVSKGWGAAPDPPWPPTCALSFTSMLSQHPCPAFLPSSLLACFPSFFLSTGRRRRHEGRPGRGRDPGAGPGGAAAARPPHESEGGPPPNAGGSCGGGAGAQVGWGPLCLCGGEGARWGTCGAELCQLTHPAQPDLLAHPSTHPAPPQPTTPPTHPPGTPAAPLSRSCRRMRMRRRSSRRSAGWSRGCGRWGGGGGRRGRGEAERWGMLGCGR